MRRETYTARVRRELRERGIVPRAERGRRPRWDWHVRWVDRPDPPDPALHELIRAVFTEAIDA